MNKQLVNFIASNRFIRILQRPLYSMISCSNEITRSIRGDGPMTLAWSRGEISACLTLTQSGKNGSSALPPMLC